VDALRTALKSLVLSDTTAAAPEFSHGNVEIESSDRILAQAILLAPTDSPMGAQEWGGEPGRLVAVQSVKKKNQDKSVDRRTVVRYKRAFL
jgi:hypothetical protein